MVEHHPFPPFVPPDAKVLIMGTFPPQPQRWAMEFYYPNRINDFWRIMGMIFLDDAKGLFDEEGGFRLDAIKALLNDKGIALHDTGREVRRLRDNASDKFLEIVTPVDLDALLAQMPGCHVIATTGQKAAEVIAGITSTPVPRMGEVVETVYKGRPLKITRMPSTSRAYPLKIDKKAEHYASLMHLAGAI